jgi:hypothetical protein
MQWPLVVFLVTWCLGLIATGMSNLAFLSIVREVNAASPADRRVGFWMMGWKSWAILKRHRELFPESKKRYKMGWLAAMGTVLLAGALIGGTIAANARWIKN